MAFGRALGRQMKVTRALDPPVQGPRGGPILKGGVNALGLQNPDVESAPAPPRGLGWPGLAWPGLGVAWLAWLGRLIGENEHGA